MYKSTCFIALMASSIDGRIALTASKKPDWTSKEDWIFLQKMLSGVDAVVVGRNTYHAAINNLRQRNTYVFSKKLKKVHRRGNVRFLNPRYVDLKKLLQKYRTVAVLGGGAVYSFMLEQGMMDEIFVTVEPLIFGRGKFMFAGGLKTTKLKLLKVRKLNSKGTLLLHYKIIH